MSKKRSEITLKELLKSIKIGKDDFDKRMVHEKTGLEFYVQSKERYGDKWFTLACKDDINIKWTGHYIEIREAFYFEKKY